MAFHRDSTTDEVLAGIDLTGRRYLVTGAGSGLGTETVRVLAAHGAAVLATVRDPSAPGDGLAALLDSSAVGSLELVALELGSLDGVRSAADALVAAGRPLDGVCANAGVMGTPEGTTVDGFETQFGVNHLGHFVLIGRLLPLLLDGSPSRVITVSSAGHRIADIDLDDPNWRRRPYDKWEAYGAAKTANILHAVELTRRFADRGLTADSVHPGGIRTNLGRHFSTEDRERIPAIMKLTGEAAFKSLESGTATQVWGLAHPELAGAGGRYLFDCTIGEPYEHPEAIGGYAPWALDADRARRLWEVSEELVGEQFA
ncbi:MAG: SDR family NAD(P)-dependent oxidoreductase [Actinomycetota bacterium]